VSEAQGRPITNCQILPCLPRQPHQLLDQNGRFVRLIAQGSCPEISGGGAPRRSLTDNHDLGSVSRSSPESEVHSDAAIFKDSPLERDGFEPSVPREKTRSSRGFVRSFQQNPGRRTTERRRLALFRLSRILETWTACREICPATTSRHSDYSQPWASSCHRLMTGHQTRLRGCPSVIGKRRARPEFRSERVSSATDTMSRCKP
jgi:hypothetical protein